MTRRLVPLILLLALGACSQPRVWAHMCPPASTGVTWDNGQALAFAGADPENRGICRARRGEAESRYAYGLVEQVAAEGRGHVEGLAPLFPARLGSTARYRSTVRSPGSGVQYDYDNAWRVVGFEPVTVPAGRFDALVLERRVVAAAPNNQHIVMRYAVDTATGIVVRREVTVERGSTLQRGFQATQLRAPPPPPAR